jgi:uncharacterized DUF497 family protein
MKIVFDENKRKSNLDKHRLDFSDLTLEFFANALVVAAKLIRMKAIGAFENGTISVVFFVLGSEGISVVSIRPASKLERKLYVRL